MVLYNMPSKSYFFDSLPIACDNNHMQNTYFTCNKNLKFILNLIFLLFSIVFAQIFCHVFCENFYDFIFTKFKTILLKNRIYEIFKSCFATTLSCKCKCYPFWTKKFKKIKYKSSPNCKN